MIKVSPVVLGFRSCAQCEYRRCRRHVAHGFSTPDRTDMPTITVAMTPSFVDSRSPSPQIAITEIHFRSPGSHRRAILSRLGLGCCARWPARCNHRTSPLENADRRLGPTAFQEQSTMLCFSTMISLRLRSAPNQNGVQYCVRTSL